MSLQNVAAAMQRVQSAFTRRPTSAVADDGAAVTHWQGGLGMRTVHASGLQVLTDMPAAMGGSGEHVSPGWLMRAGLASCLATRITMEAAARGIDLTALQVTAESQSDSRGLLGMSGDDKAPIPARPLQVQLHVILSANNASPDALSEMVEYCQPMAPVSDTVAHSVPIALSISVGAH